MSAYLCRCFSSALICVPSWNLNHTAMPGHMAIDFFNLVLKALLMFYEARRGQLEAPRTTKMIVAIIRVEWPYIPKSANDRFPVSNMYNLPFLIDLIFVIVSSLYLVLPVDYLFLVVPRWCSHCSREPGVPETEANALHPSSAGMPDITGITLSAILAYKKQKKTSRGGSLNE
ncbi:unnamed protein product [Amoebophrya sp. A25]|nr:unnamed protein product [Amoebophrya sp. A25]|eukprot:GSA25T00009506001.1